MIIKASLFAAAGIVGSIAFLGLTKTLQIKTMIAAGASAVTPDEVVTAAQVAEQTWEDRLSATGSLVAVQGVTVSAEAPGKIVSMAFEAGADVKAGALLVQLDVSNEDAQLRAAEASVSLAKLNLDRARELLAKGSMSQAEFDAGDAQFKQSTAQADSLRAVIAKKTIRAPFAGRLGLRQVNLGQILKEGDPIGTLQTLDPIYMNFSFPQQRVSALAAGNEVRVTSDAAPGQVFEGRINAVNPEVDPATRNVRAQATLANKEGKLRPGMFAGVEVVLPQTQKVLAIPATSVLYAPFGDSVFVVETKKNDKTGKEEKVLRQQFVKLGAARGDFVAVVSGLKSGDTVVTAGVFKLRGGITVTIDTQPGPEFKLNPKPNDA